LYLYLITGISHIVSYPQLRKSLFSYWLRFSVCQICYDKLSIMIHHNGRISVNSTRFDPYKNFKLRIKWDGK
jgi:hypothetical protein